MNNQHTAHVVSVDQFLSPLTVILTAHSLQRQDLQIGRMRLNEMMVNIIKSHEALPLQVRPRQLFALEDELNSMAQCYRKCRDQINQAIEHLHQIAQDALTIDPRYREGALRIVYEAEQIAKDNVKTIDIILEEVDLTNSKLLTIH